MNQHTNEPKPFLLEIHGLKPLSFEQEAVEASPDVPDVKPSNIETHVDEAGMFAPDREPEGFVEMEVWRISSTEEVGIVDRTRDAREFDDDADDFDDLP